MNLFEQISNVFARH